MRKPSPATPFYVIDTTQMIAANIEAAMRQRQMTKPALSEASGLAPRTVGNFIRPASRPKRANEQESPSSGTIANLLRLAHALGMQPWELFMPEPQRRYHVAIEEAFTARETKRR